MRIIYAILTATLLTDVALTEVLVQEDFKNDRLAERGCYDIAKWGPEKSLSIATVPDIKPISGNESTGDFKAALLWQSPSVPTDHFFYAILPARRVRRTVANE